MALIKGLVGFIDCGVTWKGKRRFSSITSRQVDEDKSRALQWNKIYFMITDFLVNSWTIIDLKSHSKFLGRP